MANSDIPNTNSMSSANSVNQQMRPFGNTPFWQQQASSMNNFPIGGRMQMSPIGPFGPTGPSQRPMNNFTPRPSLGGFGGMMGSMMGMQGSNGPMRGFGMPQQSMGNQPLINSGIGGLMAGMGMQQQPQQPNVGGIMSAMKSPTGM